MLLVARKNLFAERTRLAISVGGVALSVLLIMLLLALYRGWDEKVGGFVEDSEVDVWIASEGAKDFLAAASLLPAAEGIATANDQEFQKAWSAAQAAWKIALETVDAQLGKLQQTLRSSEDEELRDIAEFGLNGVTGNFKVPLLAAMQDIEAARDDARGSQARRATQIATGFLKHIENATEVAACDENPFGVQVSIRKTLGGALAQLNDALKMARTTEAS